MTNPTEEKRRRKRKSTKEETEKTGVRHAISLCKKSKKKSRSKVERDNTVPRPLQKKKQEKNENNGLCSCMSIHQLRE